MQFKKGSYEIICRPNEEHKNIYLKTITGYLFEMCGYPFGVEKEINLWFVTDLKTGRLVATGERRKDAVNRLENRLLRHLGELKTEFYKNCVSEFEQAKMEENKNELL